ncbi:hypothetical protein Efla_002130 [Eimeria flavescens]
MPHPLYLFLLFPINSNFIVSSWTEVHIAPFSAPRSGVSYAGSVPYPAADKSKGAHPFPPRSPSSLLLLPTGSTGSRSGPNASKSGPVSSPRSLYSLFALLATLTVFTIKIAAAVAEFKSMSLSRSQCTGRFSSAGCIYPKHAPAGIQGAQVTSPEISTMTAPPTRRELHRHLEERHSRAKREYSPPYRFICVSGSRTARPMHSMIIEVIGEMHTCFFYFKRSTTKSGIGDSCYVVICFSSELAHRRQLRRFVEVPAPKKGIPERLDLKYSYVQTGSRRETRKHAWEDHWRRWTAFHFSTAVIVRSLRRRRGKVKGFAEGTPLVPGLLATHSLGLSPLAKSPLGRPQLPVKVLEMVPSTSVTPVSPVSSEA